MKIIRAILPLLYVFATAFASRATVLFEDSTNYPYANGLIEGQGQWYCFSPKTPYKNAYVTNNVLLMVTSSTNDSVGTPTNGWVNPTEFNYASFRLNVSQLPATADGGFFAQLQNTDDTNDACHVFIQTQGTSIPGTYRLAIANYLTSYTYTPAPVTYSEDLATGVWYTVVMLYDNNQADSTFEGSTLWINPSEQDYQNLVEAGGYYPSGVAGVGFGYVSGIDYPTTTNQLYFQVNQIGFSSYIWAGISNVIAATAFNDVNSTNLPVFGIQPQGGTNYSGNPANFYAVASGVDLNYQWCDSSGPLPNGGNYSGVNTNTLVVNSLSTSDTYYCVVTDVYGNILNSSNAVETVITTPTAPFFPTNVVAMTNYPNLFTTGGFTNIALGTGPLYYQWYFAPTNTPNTFTPMSGQNSPILSLFLADYSADGFYYLSASNAINGGSIALSPTNELMEISPTVATIPQLHNLMNSFKPTLQGNRTGTTLISTNVSVGGYVTTYGGFGSTYTEFYIQDASGYGVQIYLQSESGYSSLQNTNTPPVGTYVTVTGELEVYDGQLELAPATIVPGGLLPMTTNTAAPVIPIGPALANSFFNDLITNDFGTNALNYDCSLLTFTNVYIYYNKNGTFNGIANTNNLGLFHTNATTTEYFTVGGPYSYPNNTNTMELYQIGYDYPEGTFGSLSPTSITNAFYGQTIPIYCSQLTGVWVDYAMTNGGELEPSRPADYVTNPPAPFTTTVLVSSKGAATVSWTPQVGSTYTVTSATNLLGPWMQAASGLTYYPTNGAYTDTNRVPVKFYKVSSP